MIGQPSSAPTADEGDTQQAKQRSRPSNTGAVIKCAAVPAAIYSFSSIIATYRDGALGSFINQIRIKSKKFSQKVIDSAKRLITPATLIPRLLSSQPPNAPSGPPRGERSSAFQNKSILKMRHHEDASQVLSLEQASPVSSPEIVSAQVQAPPGSSFEAKHRLSIERMPLNENRITLALEDPVSNVQVIFNEATIVLRLPTGEQIDLPAYENNGPGMYHILNSDS